MGRPKLPQHPTRVNKDEMAQLARCVGHAKGALHEKPHTRMEMTHPVKGALCLTQNTDSSATGLWIHWTGPAWGFQLEQ